jgi:hypothetical protein
MSSNTVSSAGTIDGLAGLLTFGVKIATFTGASLRLSFPSALLSW